MRHLSGVVHEDVGGLHVPVHQAGKRVEVIKTRSDLHPQETELINGWGSVVAVARRDAVAAETAADARHGKGAHVLPGSQW